MALAVGDPVDQPLSILRIACSRFVRLISHPLRGTRTTGRLSRYKTGQIMNSQQPTRVRSALDDLQAD